jgi:hypothetical protein
LVAKAEKLENDGDYRGAAEIVAAALSRAHADGVKPTKPLTLVNMDSAVIPRRSYVERYKARLRVDWQKWERTSMRGIVSVAMQAASERSEGAWLGDAEEEASTPAALLVRASFSGPVTPDADEEWHAETLAKKEEAGKVELVHTCCDGTKIATSVTPFELPVKTVQAFNHDPKKTMKALYKGDPSVENGPVYTHEQVSRWLLTANKISKNRIGEYLGRADPDAIKTLIAFLAPLDLSAFSFDEALRFFLSLFRLVRTTPHPNPHPHPLPPGMPRAILPRAAAAAAAAPPPPLGTARACRIAMRRHRQRRAPSPDSASTAYSAAHAARTNASHRVRLLRV